MACPHQGPSYSFQDLYNKLYYTTVLYFSKQAAVACFLIATIPASAEKDFMKFEEVLMRILI